MTPGLYTELFFLDEVTAFAAGHRPCNDCQKERLKVFKNIWLDANTSEYSLASKNMKDIDAILQEERIDSAGCKVKFLAEVESLPDGTVVEIEEKYLLKWKNLLLEWSFDGYVSASQVQKGQQVQVLTPRSIVRCFSKGFIPKVHDSVERFLS
ncbi:hypothetical protein EG832_01590 [bacterium]|nr:hypothetical protein [bacterium]